MEFNDICLMPSLTPTVCVLPSHSFPFFLCIASHIDVHMGYSCQASPATVAHINSPRLLWSVFVYDPNGFACKHAVGRNINVMGYLFLEGTRAMSSPSFYSFSLLFLHPNICSNTLFFQNLAHYTRALGAGLACREP